MKLTEAKQQFISSWGAFGTHWGINRTMAQIHALLLISSDPATQDDIMDELQKDLFRAIFAEGAPDESALQQAVQTTFVGRDYERAADHAVTIARWVRFIATGELPGHEPEDS